MRLSPEQIYPTRDWVLMKPESQAYTTPAGIIVKEERFTPEIRWGVVYAVGPDVRETLKAGDRIYADGQQRRNLDLDGELFWLVPEKWIFVVMEDDDGYSYPALQAA